MSVVSSTRSLACAALFALGLHTPIVRSDEAAVSSPPAPDSGALYDEGALAARAGQVDRAFELLDKSVTAGFSDGPDMYHDADLDRVRSDPRWAELLARFNRANPAARLLVLLRNQRVSAAERYFPVKTALAGGLRPPPRMAPEFFQTFATST